MAVLSLQSWVSYGHVGNAAAVFPLQRLGHEVWAVNTVNFSNHTGYGAWGGEAASPALIAALVAGIAARGVLPGCDAVLSGYLGDPALGACVLDAIARVRAANPRAVLCCDPVIGDEGTGEFVRPGVADFLRDQAVPAADLLTPNHFELERLSGRPCRTLDAAMRAVRLLQGRMAEGPRRVLVTSLRCEDTPPDSVDLLAADRAGVLRLRSPRLPGAFNGAGDLIAALFLHHHLRGDDLSASLSGAASAVHGVLRRTAEAGAPELLLVAAQEELVHPTHRLVPTPL